MRMIFTYIGSAIPDITYGATLNMEYKGFDFTMFIYRDKQETIS